ncbi:MAG: acyl-CoA dehydratase activase [Dehalococcoidia bacterium]|nr:acyl-CoA dehydratase activase [Dehalococcoidia bacterium]
MLVKQSTRWSAYSWKDPDRDWTKAKNIVAGVDVGSVGSKALVLTDGQICCYSGMYTGSNSPRAAEDALNLALKDTGMKLENIQYTVGTGYGRVNVPFANKTITEIGCHARGAHWFFPSVRTILDMGGQDCKGIHCDETGRVTHFLMNDKCAAGTGRSMEIIGEMLGVPVDEIGDRSLDIVGEIPPVSSTCVVFAKSEAFSLLQDGVPLNEVLAAYCDGLARRVHILIQRIKMEPDFAITGGIAKNRGVVQRVEKAFGVKAMISPEPQIVGALGAALFAKAIMEKQARGG